MPSFADAVAAMTQGNPIRGTMAPLSGNIEQDMENFGFPQTQEGMACMGLVYAAADIDGTSACNSKQYTDHGDITITGKYPRTYTPDLDGSGAVVRGMNHANGGDPKFVPSRASDNDYGEYGAGNINLCPEPELGQFYRIVALGKDDWTYHLFMLCGTSEAKDLTQSQIKSYFAWKKTPGVEGNLLEKLVPKLTVGLPNIADDRAMRQILGNEKWVIYRLTFSTGGQLVAKMARECPEKYLAVFSAATKNAISAYNNDPSKEALFRAIPEKALGICYAYLKVTDQLVGNLWSLKKSYETMTVQEKMSLENWFTEAKSSMSVYGKGVAGVGKGKMPRSVMNV